MADFTGVIRRAVEGLATNTPEARQKVYDRARQTIQRQLEAMPNSSSSAVFERQLSSVEDAIKEIESEYVNGSPSDDGAAAPPLSAPVSTPLPTSSVSTPLTPIAPVAKPADIVVEHKEEPPQSPEIEDPKPQPAVPQTPDLAKSVDAAPTPATPEVEPVDQSTDLLPASVDPSQSDATEEIESIQEEASSLEDEPASVVSAPPEPFAPKAAVDDVPLEPVQKTDEDIVPSAAVKSDVSEEKVSAKNEIDDELAIPPVGNSPEAATTVDDKVSEIVSGVTSKVDVEQSIKEMPKAETSFLTDDNIIDQAVGEIKSSLQTDATDTNSDFPDHDSTFGFGAEALPEAPEPKRKKSPIVMIVAAVLLVLAGSAYGVWRYGVSSFNGDETQVAEVVETPAVAETVAPETAPAEEREVVTRVEETAPATNEAAPVGDAEKFTQRLNADGTEEDLGPSPEVINGLPGEEGRSVSAQSDGQSTTEPAQQTEPVADGTPSIEKMLFYETSLGLEQQARYEGGVTWSEEVESDGTVSRPFIRAQIQVPERGLSIDMSIKLNGDQTLPVSHLIDINFSLPDDFEGGEIDQVTEVKMKNTEEQPGDRLAAISAKIDTTFFVVGLENDDQDVVATNLQLLARRNWIDIPISYSNGRKALITLEKGASGVAIFDKVLAAWDRNPVQ